MAKLHIIIGSTREKRIGATVAAWAHRRAQEKGLDTELVDLRDWPLPFYNEVAGPKDLKGNYSVDIAKQWAKKVGEADGFLIVTAEYNHGYPAVLKNALDYVYEEWNGKPVAFVGYGGIAAGARSVEQLRTVAIELQMVPLRSAVHIPFVSRAFDAQGNAADERMNANLDATIADLDAWATKLKSLRA